jgi:hypothetical protein
MMSDDQTSVIPWYRQFWPWYIIGLLFLGVFGSGVLVISAIDHQDPIVVDDYYKEGLAINRTLDRQRAAVAMGLQAQADFDASKGVLSVRLSAKHEITAPTLKLFFMHATLANRDYHVKLTRQGADLYQAQVKSLQPGNYDLKLEPEDEVWRLDAHLTFPAQSWKLKPEL